MSTQDKKKRLLVSKARLNLINLWLQIWEKPAGIKNNPKNGVFEKISVARISNYFADIQNYMNQ